MKRIILITLIITFENVSMAQEPQQLDTIYANEKMNLALFFPTNIRQGIVGSENFVLSYNRERAQPLGLLKATKGNQSNLLVVTTDGKVYSYIIEYAASLTEMNRFVSFSESIGHEHQRASLVVPDTIKSDSNLVEKKQYPTAFLEESCMALLKQQERKNIIKRKEGLSLAIKNMVYYEDLIFMQFEIKNKSGIDFDIDTLHVFKVNGKNKRKASYQELQIKPVHVFRIPSKVRIGSISRFVYVLPKFTLGGSEKLYLQLKESSGSRLLALITKF